jgi:hypothetical protein
MNSSIEHFSGNVTRTNSAFNGVSIRGVGSACFENSEFDNATIVVERGAKFNHKGIRNEPITRMGIEETPSPNSVEPFTLRISQDSSLEVLDVNNVREYFRGYIDRRTEILDSVTVEENQKVKIAPDGFDDDNDSETVVRREYSGNLASLFIKKMRRKKEECKSKGKGEYKNRKDNGGDEGRDDGRGMGCPV